MAHADTTRINQIHLEHSYLIFHDAALISIENQLYRIAEALDKPTPAPEEPEAENALDRKLEHAAVMDLLHMFLNAAEERIVNET